MLKINVDIAAFARRMKEEGGAIRARVTQGVELASAEVINVLRAASPRATGDFAGAWVATPVASRALVPSYKIANTADHARYAEYGREPGRRPPLPAIAAWVRAKGIAQGELGGADDESSSARTQSGALSSLRLRVGAHRKLRRSTAQSARSSAKRRSGRRYMKFSDIVFAIALKIGEDGTNGADVVRKNRARFQRILERHIRKALAKR